MNAWKNHDIFNSLASAGEGMDEGGVDEKACFYCGGGFGGAGVGDGVGLLSGGHDVCQQ